MEAYSHVHGLGKASGAKIISFNIITFIVRTFHLL